jgi:F-type H+-transporting ATPase subunit c
MDPKLMLYLGASICMGLGAIGPGLGLGNAVGKAFESLGRNPESSKAINSILYPTLGLIEAVAIYALLISLALVFVKG